MISPLFFLEIESILILDTNSETPLPPENVCIVISVVTTIYDVIIRASNGHLVLGGPLPDFPYVPKKQFKIIKIVPFS